MRLEDQLKYEAEGAAFAEQAKVDSFDKLHNLRAQCPYPPDSFEWNHWVFGCERAASPQATHFDGSQIWCSTSPIVGDAPVNYLLKWPTGLVTDKNGKAIITSSSY